MIKKHSILLYALLLLSSSTAYAEWSGNISAQVLYFVNDPLDTNPEQKNSYLSLAAEPEYYTSFDNEQKSFTFTPFVRIDQYDSERSHADIRELNYEQVFDNWELRIGISKVFWGVTESQHLVDVINQTDNVESPDGEEKLGQPMIKASFEQDWGTLDVFILPYFRERTFQSPQGRPRFYPFVDASQASYESSRGQKNTDYALRWFQYLGDLEFGISYFNGTSREPVFLFNPQNTSPTLSPYYTLMQQFGFDAQITTEEWLWKLEAIYRDWTNMDYTRFQLFSEQYFAATAGFEYTFVGIYESDSDLGLIMEYLYDDRGRQATTIFQNDIMLGMRLAMNDADSSEALVGIIYDIDSAEYLIQLEASKRFMENFKASLDIRSFQNVDKTSWLYSYRNDSFIQLDIAYYF